MGFAHAIVCLGLVAVGSLILFNVKGTGLHKLTGRIYVFGMVIWILLILFNDRPIYFGAYLVFMNLGWILALLGILPLILRKRIKIWVIWHYILMLNSLLSVLLAAISFYLMDHVTTFFMNQQLIESEANVASRIVCWFIPIIIGTIWIMSKKRYYESKFRNYMMRYP